MKSAFPFAEIDYYAIIELAKNFSLNAVITIQADNIDISDAFGKQDTAASEIEKFIVSKLKENSSMSYDIQFREEF